MVKQYGVSQKMYMLICLLRTRLFYRGSRLIRFPFDIRNRKHISLGKKIYIRKKLSARGV